MKKAILLVDDEQIILDSLQRDLGGEGYLVVTAASGDEAIAKLQDGVFDLVITDLVMSGTGGIEVLAAAKRIDAEICVIIQTGFGDMTSAIEALRLGADDYLLKPCDSEELLLRMARLLEKKEALAKLKIYEDILPVCMYCKKIRDDRGTRPGKGVWLSPDQYLLRRGGVEVSHGCCPDCCRKFAEEP